MSPSGTLATYPAWKGAYSVAGGRSSVRWGMSSSYALLLTRDPVADARVENAERDCAGAEHFVVKGAYIERCTELPGCVLAQLANLQLTDLVGERLSGPGDVPVDLDGDVMQRLAAVHREVIDGVLTRPPHRVQPRVDHEAHGTPHIVRECAESRIGIGVQPQIAAKRFGVQTPPFDERGESEVFAELGNVLQLLCERNLKVVSGNRLVDGEGFHLPLRPRLQVVRVGVEVPGARRLGRARHVVGGGDVPLRVRRHGDHSVRHPRQATEETNEPGVDSFRDVPVFAQETRGVGEEEPRIGAQKLDEIAEPAAEPRLRDDAVHLAANAFHLAQ